MLVLSRKLQEEIVITLPDGEIVVQVVDITPNRVRLGIVADKAIPVHRREIQDMIEGEHTN